MEPKEYAEYHKMPAQGADESDDAFRRRVAARLREMGNITEAHEVLNNCRWDDETNGHKVKESVMGALALAVNGSNWNGGTVAKPADGDGQLLHDYMAGVIANDPRPKMTAEEAILIMTVFGGGDRR